jgi:hypothetical protein
VFAQNQSALDRPCARVNERGVETTGADNAETTQESKEATMNTTHRFATAVIVFLLSALVATSAAARGTSKAAPATSNASGPLTLTVDCSKGQTISHALQQGDERKALVLVVKGTCNENVTITRDDVRIEGASGIGATVNAADANENTITVRGARVELNGLTVTGGSDGIAAIGADLLIQDGYVLNAAADGIRVLYGHAEIVRSVIQYSGNIGVEFIQATGGAYESQIVSNSAHGMTIDKGSSVDVDGSTVGSNGGAGVWLYDNSTAVIDGCTITANGASPDAGPISGVGVSVNFSHADIRNSSITDHPYRGIVSTGAVQLANSSVTGNGSDGVVLFLGAKLSMTGATISGNNGHGVFLIGNSSGHIMGSTIQSNTGSGIQLSGAAMLWLSEPSSTAGGNGIWGLDCNDAESSVNDTSWLVGSVSPGCTGF